VPNRALVEGESRYLRLEDGERLPEELERLAAEIGHRREVRMTFTLRNRIRPLVPGDASHSWARRATELAAAAGWTLEVEKDRGGISFPNFLSDPGEIPILDGLGPVGGGMHTRQEFVDLTSLDRRIPLLAELLAAGFS
jgi:glutamate carboxypeptidase